MNQSFPEPPPGKTVWPWTRVSEALPALMPDGSPWPMISVVTPSFNQGQFIEETIRSVLLQGYPNLEYIILDGGSTDESVEIIKKYEPWLTYWASEVDAGQSSAINKGFTISTGKIFAWLNSDDFFSPNMLTRAALYLHYHPEIGMLYGDRNIIDNSSKIIEFRKYFFFFKWQLRYMSGIPQETAFWRADIFKSVGLVDEQLQYAMDYDLWWRFSRVTKIQYIPEHIGYYRNHEKTKGNISSAMVDSPFQREVSSIRKKYMQRSLYPGERIILIKTHSIIRRFYYYFVKIGLINA